MKRAMLIVLMSIAMLPGCASAATIPVSSLLPKGARLLKEAKIAGYSHAVAVCFRLHGAHIAVAQVSAPGRLLWSSGLSSVPKKLISPGPTGVFVVETASGGRRRVSAYRLHAGTVAWAFSGGKGQPIDASSLKASGKTIVVDNPDSSHQGSVPYRFTTTYKWQGSKYGPGATVHQPALSPSIYPRPNGVAHLPDGDVVLMKLETAWTLAQQEHGLMDRASLDPDSGMVFIWPGLVDDTFYMANTEIPLSIAFLGPDGKILDIQDMAAEDAQTLHSPDPSLCASQVPGQCYQYAIEMNKGYFTDNGIQIGDKVQLTLPCSTFQGFQSAYVKCYS